MFSKYRSYSLHTGVDNMEMIPEKEPDDTEADTHSEIVKADFSSHQIRVKEYIRSKPSEFFMNKGHCLYKDRGTYIYMLYQTIVTRSVHSVNKYLQMPDSYTIEQYVQQIWDNSYKDVNSIVPCLLRIDTRSKKQEHEGLKALIGDQLTDLIIRGNNTITINEVLNKYRLQIIRKLGELSH